MAKRLIIILVAVGVHSDWTLASVLYAADHTWAPCTVYPLCLQLDFVLSVKGIPFCENYFPQFFCRPIRLIHLLMAVYSVPCRCQSPQMFAIKGTFICNWIALVVFVCSALKKCVPDNPILILFMNNTVINIGYISFSNYNRFSNFIKHIPVESYLITMINNFNSWSAN